MENAPQTKSGDSFKIFLAIVSMIGGFWAYSGLHIAGVSENAKIAYPILGIILALLIVFVWAQTGKRLLTYFKQSIAEFKKVVWPSNAEAMKITIFVVIFTLAFSLFMYATDGVISWVFALLVKG